MPTPDSFVGEIEQFLLALHPGGPWVIGVLRPDGTLLAYPHRNIHDAVARAVEHDQDPEVIAIYAALQRAKDSIFDKHTLSNADIECFTHLLIDIDRKGDKQGMATDSEVEELFCAVQCVRREMKYRGAANANFTFPLTTEVMTGNGYSLIYRLHEPLPNTPETQDLVKTALNGLSDRCSQEIEKHGAEIDVSVHNPARWTRLAGTVNRKFAATDTRPWRRSKLHYATPEPAPCPSTFLPLLQSWLKALPKTDADHGLRIRDGIDIEKLLADHGLRFDRFRASQNQVYLAYHALHGKCLLKNAPHQGGRNNRQSCFVMDQEKRLLYHTCFAEGCQTKTRKTVTALLNLGVNVDEIKDKTAQVDFSDQAMVAAFADANSDTSRFMEDDRSWWSYRNGVWCECPGGPIYECGEFLKAQEAEGASAQLHHRLHSEKLVQSVLRLAKGRPELRASATEFDPDPWTLGIPDGLKLDLRTGAVSPATPSDFITRTLAVRPADTATCPRWLQYLEQVHPGAENEPLRQYLKRLVGYYLTASTREEQITFFIGPGGGGKGTFSEVVGELLGPYYLPLSLVALLEDSNEDRRANYLARLHGARLALCNEGSKLKRLDSRTIKELTGGGVLSGRRLGHQPFQFHMTHKLLVVANSDPVLDIDDAMKQRIHVVPFNIKFRNTERDDKNLKDFLKQNELAGILRWAIDGCLEWQRTGLVPPESVITRTETFFGEADLMEKFLSESTEDSPTSFCPTRQLFSQWDAYCHAIGERGAVGTERTFVTALKEKRPQLRADRPGGKGFTKQSGFWGLKLLTADFGEMNF